MSWNLLTVTMYYILMYLALHIVHMKYPQHEHLIKQPLAKSNVFLYYKTLTKENKADHVICHIWYAD